MTTPPDRSPDFATRWLGLIQAGEALVRRRLSSTPALRRALRPLRLALNPLALGPLHYLLDQHWHEHPQLLTVQIGSNDGAEGDPVREFLHRHQSPAVLVEPVPDICARLRRNYAGCPAVRFENAAISTHNGRQIFHALRPASLGESLPAWYDQIGSFSRENLLKHADVIPDLEARIVETEVECLSFAALCDRHAIGHIGLLHVDAEGYDYEVIRQVDFANAPPQVLLFEHRHLPAEQQAACSDLLDRSGYRRLAIHADTLCVHEVPANARLLRALARIEQVLRA